MKCYRHGRLCRRVKVEPSMISKVDFATEKEAEAVCF